MCITHLPITLYLGNCGNIICCRHYREVEIPLRQSQWLDEQSGFGKPGTSRDDAAFSRYESDGRTIVSEEILVGKEKLLYVLCSCIAFTLKFLYPVYVLFKR
jgi:hypothetical protein